MAVRNLAPCLMSGYSTAKQHSDFFSFFSQSLSADCTLVMVLKDCPKVFSWKIIKKTTHAWAPGPVYTGAAVTHIVFVGQ